MQAVTKLMIGLVALLPISAACTDTDSTTNLNAEGPPMLRQVRMNHRVFDANGNSQTRRVFGFGTHELASIDELKSNQITDGVVLNNTFRLVMDELLVGNALEEVACRSQVDEDAFSPVPRGATPDDIARCAVQDDVLPSSCGGPTAVCICAIPGGCTSLTGAPIAEGAPVGVLDVNQDGATDDSRFKAGAISFNCLGADGGSIEVPINLENTYWNPSGDQNKPAMGGFESLGPAIVLAAGGMDSNGRDHGATLPTSSSCTLQFAESVVDKTGIQVCAPPDGDVTLDCEPGDMSQFRFETEVLDFLPITFVNNSMGASRMGPAILAASAPVLASTAVKTNITITENGAPFLNFEPDLDMPQVLLLNFHNGTPGMAAPLAANATYVITISQEVTDTYDQPAPSAKVFTFTTGAN